VAQSIKKEEKALSPLDKLLWAIIGLLLTISGVFIEVTLPLPQLTWPINWSQLQTYSLGVTLQVGAILLVGCMAGRTVAALSQITYLILGLSGFQIFAQGGGLGYLSEPTFGYLLGFLPGAALCGHLAFQQRRRLETFMMSCLWGLLSVHVVGLVYLSVLCLFRVAPVNWWTAVLQYSIYPLPGQFIVACTVAVFAYLLRIILMY
jgi:biotin transport system substrate-specific component